MYTTPSLFRLRRCDVYPTATCFLLYIFCNLLLKIPKLVLSGSRYVLLGRTSLSSLGAPPGAIPSGHVGWLPEREEAAFLSLNFAFFRSFLLSFFCLLLEFSSFCWGVGDSVVFSCALFPLVGSVCDPGVASPCAASLLAEDTCEPGVGTRFWEVLCSIFQS
ncbi:hypothetical protein GGR58DRAFT_483621 [Xylaria digitata]|nr:hypothetical protein GGR58DRAFT_483621 [Xylaria digitata]